MKNKALLDELIMRYRDLVAIRYDFENLQENFVLDESVSRELVDRVKSYFLEYVYPTPDEREILNKAFNDLDRHIKNPSHLLKLIGDAPGVLLKFGWHFPKALKAGFQILKSFKAASSLEKDLLSISLKKKVKLPLSAKDFEEIIADLPQDELKEFIEDFEHLLSALTDTKLLKKTSEILHELINRMKVESSFYSEEEVEAMQIGLDILENGYLLFDKMSDAEKREMIDLIIKAETKFLEDLAEKYNL